MKPRTKRSSQTDFYTRLNLLMDENHKTQTQTQLTPRHSYASLQNDASYIRISNSTSPMSTLTGSSDEHFPNHGPNGVHHISKCICSDSIGSLASMSLSENSNVSSSPLTNRRYSLTGESVNFML